MKRVFISLLVLLLTTMGVVAQHTVTGTVFDSTDFGVIGATVLEKGTTNGTLTDLDGNFSIQTASPDAVVVISYVGMKSMEIQVKGRSHVGKIVLVDDSQMLEEVVIVGFGTQKKINATGAVKTIDAKVMESRPISNAVQGLQGAVSGLNITNDNGGELGGSMGINIRGVGTIGDGSDASVLVLIDGMEGDLSTINPNDIENISVLKDAASAAIYGSRAPFGVILVTTKSGGEDKVTVNYTGNVRISRPLSVPEQADSYTYALMLNDAYENAGGRGPFGTSQLKNILGFQQGTIPDGISPRPGMNEWLGMQDSYANTDWYDVYMKDQTYSHEHNLSIRGGGKKISYYLSANYLDQTGIFNYADERYSRFTINGKISAKILDNLSINYNTRLVNTDNDKPTALNNLFYHNLGRRAPTSPVTYPDGSYTKESMIINMTEGGRYNQKNTLVYNSAQVMYEPIKNWKIYADLGSRIEMPNESRQFNKIAYKLPDGSLEYMPVMEGIQDKSDVNINGIIIRQPPAGQSYYERGIGHVNYFTSNFRTDYELKRNNHYFKALAGVQTEYYARQMIRVSNDDIASDDTPFLPSGAGINPLMSEKKGSWSNLGVFARLNYNYADRYMIEVNARGDAASRFPKNQRWGFFPSVSVGWNLGQEAFWEPLLEKGFEMIKVRASYGQLGNQNTTSFYPYYQSMVSGTGSNILGGIIAPELNVPAPYAESLTWETIETIDVGLDLGFWSNRFTASFDWYQRMTKDMVGPAVTLPNIFGAVVPKTNNAELRTRGWEVEVAWRDRIGSDWSYHITASLSDYESMVTKYAAADGKLSDYYVGKRIGDMWGYEVAGIAQNDLQMQEWLMNNDQSAIGTKWGGGDLMYRDLTGDGKVNTGSNTVDDYGDLKLIGNTTPRYAYSFSLGGSWKFIDLNLFFQGIGKRDLFFNGSAPFFGIAAEWQRTLYTDHLDYYRYADSQLGANPDAYFGRLRIDTNNIQMSDRFVQDGSYLRLKNLQVGFSLPKHLGVEKVISKARIYFSAENLFTFTKLRTFDPESVGSNSADYGAGKAYPTNQVFSVGLEINFM